MPRSPGNGNLKSLSDMDVEVPIAPQHSRGIQSALQNSGEGQSEVSEIAVSETRMQLCKRDSCVDSCGRFALRRL